MYRKLDLDRRLPLDEGPFEPGSVNGVENGDWPEWPEQLMLGWVPRAIQDEYGKRQGSVLNGPFLVLDEAREDDIISLLSGWAIDVREIWHSLMHVPGRLNSAGASDPMERARLYAELINYFRADKFDQSPRTPIIDEAYDQYTSEYQQLRERFNG